VRPGQAGFAARRRFKSALRLMSRQSGRNGCFWCVRLPVYIGSYGSNCVSSRNCSKGQALTFDLRHRSLPRQRCRPKHPEQSDQKSAPALWPRTNRLCRRPRHDRQQTHRRRIAWRGRPRMSSNESPNAVKTAIRRAGQSGAD